MTILVDIGNTSIKKCDLKNGKLSNRKFCDYSKSNFTKVSNFFTSDLKNKESFVFCSVVPELNNFIIKKTKIGLSSYNFINLKFLKSFINPNINFNQLGIDRITNYLGLRNDYPAKKNFLIIDFGTATTIDIIVNNIYQGGVILPGLEISYKNLINSASLLKDFKIKFTKLVYGRNTQNALLSGSFNGYSHMINGYIKQLSHFFDIKFTVVATGGYGSIFTKNKTQIKYDKDLIFKGLKYYYENFS